MTWHLAWDTIVYFKWRYLESLSANTRPILTFHNLLKLFNRKKNKENFVAYKNCQMPYTKKDVKDRWGKMNFFIQYRNPCGVRCTSIILFLLLVFCSFYQKHVWRRLPYRYRFFFHDYYSLNFLFLFIRRKKYKWKFFFVDKENKQRNLYLCGNLIFFLQKI
jgi:hypothetical protein